MSNVYIEICDFHGDSQMSYTTIFTWFAQVSSGQESVKDVPHSGIKKSQLPSPMLILFIIEKDAQHRLILYDDLKCSLCSCNSRK